MFTRSFKVVKLLWRQAATLVSTIYVRLVFSLNGIKFGKKLRAIGIPSVNVSLGGAARVGDAFYVRTGCSATEVGAVGTRIRVGRNGKLAIGNRVGISNASIFCQNSISIGDDVFIGGGTQIFDTNFHSTDSSVRTSGLESSDTIKTAPVFIGNRVFIGTNSIICKGVVIGDDSIIAAGSVVVSSVSDNEVWAGNPARKVR